MVSSTEPDKRANAAYLMCAYMVSLSNNGMPNVQMLVYKLTPQEATLPIMPTSHLFMPYRDAGYGPATYFITILDCLSGLYKALQIGLFNIDTFDLPEYEYYEKVEHGDFNWISPKFLALASPKETPAGPAITNRLFPVTTIPNLVQYFKNHNVCTIIRLNNKLYDRKQFVEGGIEHIDLYFPDGTTPPNHILQEFLQICESRPGAIAIHCKAGLGRTGSLIGAYLMKHYLMSANEVISYMRVVRPGSVVGPQQNWMER